MIEDIITEAAAILGAIEKIGKVYDYVPVVASEVEFKNAFFNEDTGDIRAWTVACESVDVEPKGVHADRDKPNIVVRGFLSVRDKGESEKKVFRPLIKAVRDTFNANRTVNGKAVFSGRMRVRLMTQGAFLGSVLCHYCELVLPVTDSIVTY